MAMAHDFRDPLPETALAELHAEIDARGVAAVARSLGVHRTSLVSVLARTARPATRLWVAERLRQRRRGPP